MATNTNHGADPVNVLAPKQPGAPSHDDHDTSGPPAPETIKRGYEEDVYDTKTVLSVPLLVVLFFVLAFGTVTVLFGFLAKPGPNPDAHPQAKARNEADINKRLARIGRGKEVDQPRLEPLRERAALADGKADARSITRPEVAGVNSPELHPEDLIPNKDRFPDLYKADGGRKSLGATMALDDAALKDMFKSSAPPLSDEASRHLPTGANAGRGAESSLAVPPKAPAEAKQPDPKKTSEPVPPPKPKGGP